MKKHYIILLTIICTSKFWAQINVFNEYKTQGVAINSTSNTLFLANTEIDKIHKVNLNDPNYTSSVLISNVNKPQGIKFHNGFLYASLNPTDNELDKIIKINISNATPVAYTLTNSIPNPNGLFIHNDKLYVSSNNSIYTIDLLTENALPILFTDKLISIKSRVGMCIVNDYLYIIDIGKLVKFDINSQNPIRQVVDNNFWGHGLATANETLIILVSRIIGFIF